MQPKATPFTFTLMCTLSAACLALAACGGGGSSPSTPVATVPVTPPVTPPVTVAPGTLQTTVTVAPPASVGQDTIDGFNYLNQIRTLAGAGAVDWNQSVQTATQNHVSYLSNNGLFSHQEDPAKPGFTGVQPLDRMNFAGYAGVYGGEELAGGASYKDFVDGLLTAGYHSIGLLYGYRDVGFGAAGIAASTIRGMDVGYTNSKPQQLLAGDAVAMFPCGNFAVVGGAGYGESPDPLPGRNYYATPIGTPIVALVRNGQTLAVTTWTISPVGGQPLKTAATLTQANDPNKLLAASGAILIPDQPLVKGGSYTTTLAGTNNGQPFSKTCTFSVAP